MNETWAVITAITVLLPAGDALEATEAVARYLTAYWVQSPCKPQLSHFTGSAKTEPDWPIKKQKPD